MKIYIVIKDFFDSDSNDYIPTNEAVFTSLKDSILYINQFNTTGFQHSDPNLETALESKKEPSYGRACEAYDVYLLRREYAWKIEVWDI